MTTEGRMRWSRGSALRHTSQWHPIIGMPALVPVPRKRRSIGSGLIGLVIAEIQNPKSKTRKKFEYRKPKSERETFGFWIFGFSSGFGFWILDLLTRLPPSASPALP